MTEINKKIITKTNDGIVYNVADIPSSMFEFFIHKRRTFKDGTCNWAIGVSPTADTSKGFTFETFRGTETDATQRFDDIIRNYK